MTVAKAASRSRILVGVALSLVLGGVALAAVPRRTVWGTGDTLTHDQLNDNFDWMLAVAEDSAERGAAAGLCASLQAAGAGTEAVVVQHTASGTCGQQCAQTRWGTCNGGLDVKVPVDGSLSASPAATYFHRRCDEGGAYCCCSN